MSDKPEEQGEKKPESRTDGTSWDTALEAAGLSRTPMFEALNAGRYQRQGLIREIQKATRQRLICYVGAPGSRIQREDTLGFVELLHNLQAADGVDLLLHTGGGDVDAADKVATIIRASVGKGKFRVIVPDYAKSAGTLLALGADVIVMSDSSELGPIDPQVIRRDANGNLVSQSIMHYLTAYKRHSKTVNDDPTDLAARTMLNKIEPQTVVQFEAVRERAQKLAEKQLKFGMFRSGTGNFTSIPETLMDTNRFPTHGQVITYQDAQVIGLNVEYVAPDDGLWKKIWFLYCLQRIAIPDGQRLFESEFVSLPMSGSIGRTLPAETDLSVW